MCCRQILTSIMIGLLQRVTGAAVYVNRQIIGEIGPGVLVLVGVERHDGPPQAQRLAQRLCQYRVFSDSEGRMNRSVSDTSGGMLLVPQFTLAANTRKGTRASFTGAAAPDVGRQLFATLVDECRGRHTGKVATGQFGADMQVELVNDGPVTFWLQVAPGT